MIILLIMLLLIVLFACWFRTRTKGRQKGGWSRHEPQNHCTCGHPRQVSQQDLQRSHAGCGQGPSRRRLLVQQIFPKQGQAPRLKVGLDQQCRGGHKRDAKSNQRPGNVSFCYCCCFCVALFCVAIFCRGWLRIVRDRCRSVLHQCVVIVIIVIITVHGQLPGQQIVIVIFSSPLSDPCHAVPTGYEHAHNGIVAHGRKPVHNLNRECPRVLRQDGQMQRITG